MCIRDSRQYVHVAEITLNILCSQPPSCKGNEAISQLRLIITILTACALCGYVAIKILYSDHIEDAAGTFAVVYALLRLHCQNDSRDLKPVCFASV